MAELPAPTLSFPGIPPDVGQRTAHPPDPLPPVGDDFDWQLRDLRQFQHVHAGGARGALFRTGALGPRLTSNSSSPRRSRRCFDQLSDMLDRVSSEAYLETARRPESVRRLLSMIGYDAVVAASRRSNQEHDSLAPQDVLERYWLANPSALGAARRAGPPAVRTQRRMVSLSDYAAQLEHHPLVRRAGAWSPGVARGPRPHPHPRLAGLRPRPDRNRLRRIEVDVKDFHQALGLPLPPLSAAAPPPIREVLNPYLDAYRMAGQEVTLETATRVPLQIALTVGMSDNYFHSEMRLAVAQALGTTRQGCSRQARSTSARPSIRATCSAPSGDWPASTTS